MGKRIAFCLISFQLMGIPSALASFLESAELTASFKTAEGWTCASLKLPPSPIASAFAYQLRRDKSARQAGPTDRLRNASALESSRLKTQDSELGTRASGLERFAIQAASAPVSSAETVQIRCPNISRNFGLVH